MSERIRTSELTEAISQALVEAQAKFGAAIKSSQNPAFRSKYADLSSIIDATLEHLNANGISVMQHPSLAEQTVTVTTRLTHKGGQWIESDLSIPAVMRDRFDAQSVGSAITYASRYSLQSILCVPREDDDGNAAAGVGTKEQANGVAKAKLEAAGHVVSLFYVHHEDSDMYEVTGDHGLKEANRDLLKKFWSPVAGAIMLNGEQLEDLKYMLEERKVPFKLLKGNPESAVSGAPPPKSNLSEQLKASIKAVAEKKKL